MNMLTFFRKMRKSLLGSGQVQRYLLYAFGEIALVVIGILIALQVNNLNETRKDLRLEGEYYCRLLEDVEQDKIQLNEFIEQSKSRLSASNRAAGLLQKEKALKYEVGTQMNLSIRGIYADFVPNNSAFEDLKSGANLNVIQDKSIVKSLNKYYNKIRQYSSIAKVNASMSIDRFDAYKDRFAIGWVHSTMKTDRFKKGMDPEVYDAMNIDQSEYLIPEVQFMLYNDALANISANSRRLELFGFMEIEIEHLLDTLRKKCPG